MTEIQTHGYNFRHEVAFLKIMKKYLSKKSSIFLGFCIFLNIQAFGNTPPCYNIVDKELCKKIGQMLIVGFGGFKQDETGRVLWNDVNSTQFDKHSLVAKHIANDHIGGVILFTQPLRDIKTGKFIRDRNVQNPEQLAKLNQELQNYNNRAQKAQGLAPLPLFISIDQEGGRIDRLPASQGFPLKTLIPQALGTKNATNETYVYASKLATEIANAHFNLNFAPIVDVDVNPTNPIIGGLGRSFSANPKVVVNQAQQFIQAFHQHNIISVLKHFPGHGSSIEDSHEGLVDITNTYQRKAELYPYAKLINEGYGDIIMTAHVIDGQLDHSQCKVGPVNDHSTWCPATMSQKILTDLLRKKMGFKGLIVSDDITMDAIAKQYPLSETLEKAVNAGVDLFIIANNQTDQTNEVIVTLAKLIKNGKIKQETIDQAYNQIIKFKQNHLHEHPLS